MLGRFITRFAVGPLSEAPFERESRHKDQMAQEKYLRGEVAERGLLYPGPWPAGADTWAPHYSHGDIFVDRSTFYSTPTRVAFSSCAFIESDAARLVPFRLWTYAAVTVWVNGEKVCEIDEPVYKPIMNRRFKAFLKEGRNEVFAVLQTLGVRDTRTLFGLEAEVSSGLGDHYPGDSASGLATAWLDACLLRGRTILFPSNAPEGAEIILDTRSPDYAKVDSRKTRIPVGGMERVELPDFPPYASVRVPVAGGAVSRSFEVMDSVRPSHSDDRTPEGNFRRLLGVIADAEGLSRGDKFGFHIQNILARKALGIDNPRDRDNFLTTLDQIEKRYDCSDFLVSGVIRYMRNYPLDEELAGKVKDTLLNWRYWMTFEGSDGMCFWSENHSLLFYSCAMIAGDMWPDEWFPRAKMTGRELSALGRRLTGEWFDDVEKYGFEEFLSTVYMNVTFACLLNIIDYAPRDVSDRARACADKMVRELCLHTFDGSVIAPMGRVYRGVINPSKQGAQALVNLVDPDVPTSFGEGWLSYLATSSYKFPDDARGLVRADADTSYSSGNALVRLVKTRDYCLTSVQSPRKDGFKRWDNITVKPKAGVDEESHEWTKSFNERFHGTTFFQPGVYGYQQHMWTLALSNEAIVFGNHPGATSDSSSMRPGYWYGNGVMPAVRQDGRFLGAVYVIPEDHPVGFVHFFVPEVKFDEVRATSDTVFLRKGDGYAALWCSSPLSRTDDQLEACELRAEDRNCACFCAVSSAGEAGSFAAFIDSFRSMGPSYDRQSKTLEVSGEEFIRWEAGGDDTQIV